MYAAGRRAARKKIHRSPSNHRQWTLRIDLGPDRIAVMNQVETHPQNDSAHQRRGIGGWLLVVCFLLLVWGPVRAALVRSAGLSVLAVRGPSLAVALAALTLVASFGIAAGIALLLRHGPAVTMART